jgi:hypothetical protein
VLTRL